MISSLAQHPRIMMYSQDGLGLGHMRRTTSIARQLLAIRPDACVLTLADSRLGQFFESSSNHDYIKLPSILKVGPGAWRAVNLPLAFEDVHSLRRDLIRSALLSFRPHALLVDHMPHGAMGELLPALDALRESGAETQVVLGLRDILDAPEIVQRRWRAEGAYDAIERYYDRVLVYGSRDLFDMAEQYDLPPAIDSRLEYCGYVCTPELPRYPMRARAKYLSGEPSGTKLIVAMAGGGADAFPMMRAVLEAFPAVRAQQRSVLLVVTGPFMPVEQRRELERTARAMPGAHVVITVSDPLSYIEAADLVFAMAGYNTTMEILRSGRPAVLIPRAGPSAEQRTRSRLFAERGWVGMIDPDDLTAEAIAQAALERLSGRLPAPFARPDLDGLSTAVQHLVATLPPALPALELGSAPARASRSRTADVRQAA